MNDKKYILIITSLISTFIVGFIFINNNTNNVEQKDVDNITINDDGIIEFNDIKLEYYQETSYNDYIEGVSIDNDLIDTKQLGTYTVESTGIYKEKQYPVTIQYDVVDTTAPILMCRNTYIIEKGEEFDYESLFIVGDNYDKKVPIDIIGDYDLDTVGEYNIIAQCIDSSGNTTTKDIVVNVVEKIESTTTSETTYIYFDDVVQKHKTDDTSIGIDVSKWQGDIDFDKVKDAGVEFVFIRLGYEGKSNGVLYVDEKFQSNLDNAKRVGIDVGIYLYTVANSIDKAIEQADEVVSILNGIDLELPIVFDWEEWSLFRQYELSIQDLNNIADAFIDRVNYHGYEGMNYGSATYLTHFYHDDKPTWLAHYDDETWYEGQYAVWQLCDTGRIDGIYGNVDINVMYR